MRQVEAFISQVDEAIAGRITRTDEAELRNSIHRTYSGSPNTGFIARANIDSGWKQVRDALCEYRDRLDHELAVAQAAGGVVSVSANSSSTAVAHASAYAEAVAGLEGIESLTDEDRVELENLMRDVKAAKDKTLLGKAAEKLVEVAVEKGVETLPWVLPVIIEAAAKLTGA